MFLLLDGAVYNGYDADVTGSFFWIDLYFSGEHQTLVDGDYPVSENGEDVVDELALIMPDEDYWATGGTLSIRNNGDNYSIAFNGTANNGNPFSFSYTGPVTYDESGLSQSASYSVAKIKSGR